MKDSNSKGLFRFVFAVSIFISLFGIKTAYATSACPPKCIYYGGVTLTQNSMGFDYRFGQRMFAKRYPGIDGFLGIQMGSYIGLEAGYSHGKTKVQDVTIGEDEVELSAEYFSGVLGSDSYQTSVKNTKPFLQWIVFVPIHQFHHTSVIDQLSLFAGIGVSLVKLALKAEMTANDGSPATQVEQDDNRINLTIRKAVPRITGGIDTRFCQNFGIQFSLTLEKTDRLKKTFRTVASPVLRVRAKDSIIGGVSFYAMIY